MATVEEEAVTIDANDWCHMSNTRRGTDPYH